MNSRLTALRKMAECVYRLEQSSPSSPRVQRANLYAAGLLGLGLSGAAVVALASTFVGSTLLPWWSWSFVAALSLLAAAAWRRHTLACSALPDNWEDALRQELLTWPADASTQAELAAWVAQQPLPLKAIKQWLAQERAVTPP